MCCHNKSYVTQKTHTRGFDWCKEHICNNRPIPGFSIVFYQPALLPKVASHIREISIVARNIYMEQKTHPRGFHCLPSTDHSTKRYVTQKTHTRGFDCGKEHIWNKGVSSVCYPPTILLLRCYPLLLLLLHCIYLVIPIVSPISPLLINPPP